MPAGLSRGIMAAHVSTHRTEGEKGKGVYKRGQWVTESCVVVTRKKGTRTQPCRQTVQNSKADSPNKRRGHQNLGL